MCGSLAPVFPGVNQPPLLFPKKHVRKRLVNVERILSVTTIRYAPLIVSVPINNYILLCIYHSTLFTGRKCGKYCNRIIFGIKMNDSKANTSLTTKMYCEKTLFTRPVTGKPTNISSKLPNNLKVREHRTTRRYSENNLSYLILGSIHKNQIKHIRNVHQKENHFSLELTSLHRTEKKTLCNPEPP